MPTRFRTSNPDGVHPPLGPYSHSVTVPAGAELVFVSGQVGIAADGSFGATMDEQADQAFANVVSILEAHGLDASSVVKLTVFIVSGHDAEAVRNARVKHFGSVSPTSTTVFVSQLVTPEWLVEVEAIAARA